MHNIARGVLERASEESHALQSYDERGDRVFLTLFWSRNEPLNATQESTLRFSSGLSTLTDTEAAVADACDRAKRSLEGEADLAIVFASHHHWESVDAIPADVCKRVGAKSLLGCSGEAIIGGEREIEGRHAVSVWLAQMPGVEIAPLHLLYDETPEGGVFVGWPDELVDQWPEPAAMILLADPWSFPADALIEQLAEEHSTTTVVGGMASGARRPGENRLFLNQKSIEQGAVAIVLSGAVTVRTVVSQGCRPIGRHLVITRARHNIIEELGGKPALEKFQEIYETLTPDEKNMVRQGLHVGRVVNEYQSHFERGDFLVRNVIGADTEAGAIAIGDMVRPGQTVQFHVRDAETADEDLRLMLERLRESGGPTPESALVFTCNGRGSRLFLKPDHDATLVHRQLDGVPIAGFFAQGEIGPVGGRSFLHGFTASIAVFSAKGE